MLKRPYYGLWKIHILVLGVPNNRLTCMQGQKNTFIFLWYAFILPYLLNDSFFRESAVIGLIGRFNSKQCSAALCIV